MLPALHARLGSEAMLDEHQLTTGSQHAANFGQRTRWIGNTAQRIRDDRGVERASIERQLFGGCFDELDRYRRVCDSRARSREQLRRWIDAGDVGRCGAVEREVEARAHADLEHVAVRLGNPARALLEDRAAPARLLDEDRHDVGRP